MTLFPLQTLTDFAFDTSGVSPTEIIIGISVLAAFIGLILIINSVKNRQTKSKGVSEDEPPQKSAGGMSSIFSGIKLRSIARSLGLNREQTSMLVKIFKTDMVQDLEKSINTPALLDRHFKRTYRIIEQSTVPEKERQHKFSVLFSARNILENSVIGGMTSTHQMKDYTMLSLTYGKDKYNISALSAKGDYILAEAPKNALGSQIKIPKGAKFTVMFFTRNNKGFSFDTRIVGFSGRDGNPVMQLAHSNQLKFLSQRRYRRKQTSIACFLFLVYVEGSGKKQRLVVDKRRLQGNIADISVGGCSMKVMAPVQVGARLKIELSPGDEKVAVLGQTLRSNRTGAGTIVHVRFLRISEKSMNVINAFVYEYARE